MSKQDKSDFLIPRRIDRSAGDREGTPIGGKSKNPPPPANDPPETPDNPDRRIKGIWLPLEAFYNPDLSLMEATLFGLIMALDHPKTHCTASNKYLAKCLRVASARHISDMITKLIKKGYLISKGSTTRRILIIDPEYKTWHAKWEKEYNAIPSKLKEK